MTPWLRLRTRWVPAATSLLLAVPPVVAHAEEPAGPSPDASASLAGRQAGAGRERPGRPTGPEASRPEDTVPSDDPTPAATPSATKSVAPGTSRPDAQHPDAARRPESQAVPKPPSEQAVPVLTLGAGITLFGLGLGFLGLRLRRR